MAYMNQELKAKLAPAVKAILKRYNVKGTLATDRNTLTLNIKSGTLDFIGDFNTTIQNDRSIWKGQTADRAYIQVNTYHYRSHFSDKVIRKFFDEITAAMNVGNHDNSDSQIDYFDVGWYVRINVGKWNKPYIFEG
jgi:ABC-type transport system substrate-binding protein